MCRFAAYLGKPLLINEVLSKPKDSLIRQSHEARESEIHINADGFGVGWYNRAVSEHPAVYVSPLPAWNDMNLKNISHQISSSCFFGHVRAAAEGGVNAFNCHPFHYQRWMMMHNGGIGGFKTIKRDLINLLPQELYVQLKGQTDSEHMFALWLHYYLPTRQTFTDMSTAWQKTLKEILRLQALHGITEPNFINSVITDGTHMAAVRYVTEGFQPLSLYYAAGQEFVHLHHACHMVPSANGHNDAVLLVSERLTNSDAEWHEIPAQHIFTVSHLKTVHATPLILH